METDARVLRAIPRAQLEQLELLLRREEAMQVELAKATQGRKDVNSLMITPG